jgi:hypothetical protein
MVELKEGDCLMLNIRYLRDVCLLDGEQQGRGEIKKAYWKGVILERSKSEGESLGKSNIGRLPYPGSLRQPLNA